VATASTIGPPATELIGRKRSLTALRRAAAGCQACPLWRSGTQTVFGEGPPSAEVMFVGEQPGDREDRAGKPFVGPAGGVLAKALEEVGIDQSAAYVTNVVKHFKWKPGRGKRRLHQKPNIEEVEACRPWLDSELAAVEPQVLVCLGATATKALLGSQVKVTRDRGRSVDSDLAPLVTVTVHPSSIIRIDDDQDRREARELFASDLRGVAEKLS
jgi:uracil-DNA glycosylase family protein